MLGALDADDGLSGGHAPDGAHGAELTDGEVGSGTDLGAQVEPASGGEEPGDAFRTPEVLFHLGGLQTWHTSALLGYGPDADDAVQDGALTALRHIGDVRDPAAVGAWLRAVVRNTSRMRLRATRETPGLDGLDHLHPRDHEPAHPERLIEQHAMRGWIWDAMEELPPQLRLMLMLRHFSGITSYQEIAVACEVPVGTLRVVFPEPPW
ncbi:sigma-70 family RNA polymerase sigma factor [Streptomyces sp. NPDC001634]|uniref:RNA polymerase sigma factor n=1 Tax=Streptomyces sp. NPDC001634 TaxID=3154390 RepID=UPI00331F9911